MAPDPDARDGAGCPLAVVAVHAVDAARLDEPRTALDGERDAVERAGRRRDDGRGRAADQENAGAPAAMPGARDEAVTHDEPRGRSARVEETGVHREDRAGKPGEDVQAIAFGVLGADRGPRQIHPDDDEGEA